MWLCPTANAHKASTEVCKIPTARDNDSSGHLDQGTVLMSETNMQDDLVTTGIKRSARDQRGWTALPAAWRSLRLPHSEEVVHTHKTNGIKGRQLIFSAGGCNGMWVSGMRLCHCLHPPQGHSSRRALQIPQLLFSTNRRFSPENHLE